MLFALSETNETRRLVRKKQAPRLVSCLRKARERKTRFTSLQFTLLHRTSRHHLRVSLAAVTLSPIIGVTTDTSCFAASFSKRSTGSYHG